ncbi:IS4 family transposase [Desulfosediminicola ganghwensis]|uniref:IS4 family transposase n=1 Tax=Desulfosediminicola ganghwensis TaxID=2569540 RepID=UPI001594C013|nr:IS4 family transposase [Desulfosediminicola ganghwensis]
MAHSNTILNQIASFFPRHDFEKLAKKHHHGQKFRSFNRWSQFLAMTIAQVTSRKSLRDLVSNLAVQKSRLYHLGMGPTSRATLARVNEQQPYETFKAMFFQLLHKCQANAPKHRFKFKGKIYLLDATMVNLCLSVFPWASYRKSKGAMKLHFGLDASGYLPVFMDMTEGKKHEIEWARSLNLPAGSCVVFDREFTDYTWYDTLDKRKITFVTRLKSNAKVYRYGNRRKPDSPYVLEDQKIKIPGYQFTFRRIIYVDPETGIEYQFVTNSRKLKASEVAAIYKERWQIELFFKWIKQQLKVKTFLGTSENAVLTELWIALCVYLMLSYFKFMAKFKGSLTQLLRLLQLNIFERRPLADLLKPPDKLVKTQFTPQLALWD